jgi:hypothetical protein
MRLSLQKPPAGNPGKPENWLLMLQVAAPTEALAIAEAKAKACPLALAVAHAWASACEMALVQPPVATAWATALEKTRA